MDFKQYLDSSRVKIEKNLTKFLNTKKSEKLPKFFKEQKFVESLEAFVLGGKLLRGTLFLLTLEGFGKKIEKKHLDIACAIELTHSSLLIQDDIIDNDTIRRGSKTIFSKYEEEGGRIGTFNAYHYGISSAIVVADLAFFYALELLSNYKESNLSEMLNKYAHEISMVVMAEGADSLLGQTSRQPDKDQINSLYLYKTARYTFSFPFELGALLSKASKKQIKDLGKLGELMGIIFQIKDDEIGLLGEEKEIGKPVGGDIKENKKTLIRLYLYKKASPKQKRVLNNLFGNQNIKAQDIENIKKMYKELKVNQDLDKEVDTLMKKAKTIYDNLSIRKEYKNLLKELLEFNLSRSY